MSLTPRRRTIGCLLELIFLLLLAEAGFRWIDPLGIHRSFSDQATLYAGLQDIDGRVYVFRPGTYRFVDWRMTILDDYARRVPDTNPAAACTLVFLGDSVTMAWGVHDNAAWVNLLARQFADVQMINAGVNGYTSESVRGTYADYPAADALIYFVVDNDPQTYNNGMTAGRSAVHHYMVYLYLRWFAGIETDWPRFYADLDTLTADPRVTLVAFDGAFGHDLAARYTVTLVDHYGWQNTISWADGHANAAGNREIAAAMRPLVQQVIKEQCRE